jgi:hypothetical protein
MLVDQMYLISGLNSGSQLERDENKFATKNGPIESAQSCEIEANIKLEKLTSKYGGCFAFLRFHKMHV